MEKQSVTKLDAAKRQMNEAIRLLFEQRDEVSVHTLACAAGQVLCDLCKARGVPAPFRGGEMIRKKHQKEWRGVLAKSENFFKHAGRDPDAVHEFKASWTHFLLLDATQMYSGLTKRTTYEATIFTGWFFLKYPRLLKDGDVKDRLLRTAISIDVDPDDLSSFRNAIRHKIHLPPSVLESFD